MSKERWAKPETKYSAEVRHLNRKEGIIVGLLLLVTFVASAFAAPQIQQVFVTNFPSNQQVTVTNFPELQPAYQAVLWLNRTVAPAEVVTYPVAGWKTVTITISEQSSGGGLPWGFETMGVRGLYVECPTMSSGTTRPDCITIFLGRGVGVTVPVKGENVWLLNNSGSHILLQVSLYLQR